MIDFSTVKALFFDFGGVLINLDKQRCLENLHNITGCDFSEMVSNYRQAGIFLRFEKGLATEQEFYAEVRRYSRYPVTDEQIRAAWNSFLLEVPGEKKQLLLALRKQFKVFMLSNTNVIHASIDLQIWIPRSFTMLVLTNFCPLAFTISPRLKPSRLLRI